MRDKEIRFAELRLDHNLLQKDIADFLNVKEDTYSKWERGINDLPLLKCNELANYYKVSLDYLLGLSDYDCETKSKEINLMILKTRLKETRKIHDLSQEELSEILGFPQSTYSDYEIGNSEPTTFKVFHIATYYNVSLDYLVGRSNDCKIKME